MTAGDRKLAAIMFTDIVGFTALSQRNESLALSVLDDQRELLRSVFSKHSGREVKTMGDAFLVDFPSALSAVRCACEIQKTTREFNNSLPEARRVHLRIGVHLGDIIESQGDISGDAVNVASRIESLADSGGVCLTRQVYDQVQNKFELPLRSIGAKSLKNLTAPIEVFKMVMPWEEAVMVEAVELDIHRVAVLPLSNISPDTKDAYFADGMTEELITVLSQLRGLRVIARTSVDHYKSREKRISQIAQELQVGSIIEGSVRMAENRIRVSVQLINARNEEHIWSENYDRQLDDIFGIQTDIANQVAQSLKMKLIGEEKERLNARTTENVSAYMNYLEGRALLSTRRPDEIKRAKELFESTIAEDPKYAPGLVGLADAYLALGFYSVFPVQLARQRAKDFVSRALKLDPDLAEAHASLGRILDGDHDFAGAEREFRKAISLNPSYANAHVWYSFCLMDLGNFPQALEELSLAEAADPLSLVVLNNEVHYFCLFERKEEAANKLRKALEIYPENLYVRWNQSWLCYLNGDHEQAIRLLLEVSKLKPDDPIFKMDLVIVYAANGDMENAKKWLRELISLPEGTGWRFGAIAFAYTALGDVDEFFAFANRALIEKDISFGLLRTIDRWVPNGRKVLDDPRTSELFKKANLDLRTTIT